MAEQQRPPVPEHHGSRLELVWDTVIFQFKLAADGIWDVILSPVSIIAAVMGLMSGGEEPDRYFRRVQRLGRRTEIWINLFGQYRHGDTADKLLEPIEARLKDEYARGGWVTRSADQMNTLLDSLNKAHSARGARNSTEPAPGTSVKDDSKSP